MLRRRSCRAVGHLDVLQVEAKRSLRGCIGCIAGVNVNADVHVNVGIRHLGNGGTGFRSLAARTSFFRRNLSGRGIASRARSLGRVPAAETTIVAAGVTRDRHRRRVVRPSSAGHADRVARHASLALARLDLLPLNLAHHRIPRASDRRAGVGHLNALDLGRLLGLLYMRVHRPQARQRRHHHNQSDDQRSRQLGAVDFVALDAVLARHVEALLTNSAVGAPVSLGAQRRGLAGDQLTPCAPRLHRALAHQRCTVAHSPVSRLQFEGVECGALVADGPLRARQNLHGSIFALSCENEQLVRFRDALRD
mmetsp:Transcript_24947/g.86906  ORF Transcript_24947/g.86906 Transcript_24947/m.86906 type:complete len:308 (-) Transcript_24947:1042-1965(-)